MPPKSKLGQNFLHDQQAIARIVAALGDISQSTVIEIGPGRGAITQLLAHKAKRLLAVEFDPALAEKLRHEFLPEQLTVVSQDVLEFDFSRVAQEEGHKLVVVGNLPYYITSPILLHLASMSAALDRAVLMVQREVAERVTAAPDSRDYGVLTVTTQMYGPAEQLFTLPPHAFTPPPQVHSTVFRWKFAQRFEELGVNEKGFLTFVRQAFAQKRKTLANNLKSMGIAAPEIATALEDIGISAQARTEMLSIENLAALWKRLKTEQRRNT